MRATTRLVRTPADGAIRQPNRAVVRLRRSPVSTPTDGRGSGSARHGTPWSDLRDAFPFERAPRYLIYDHDAKFSAGIDRLVESFGTKPTRTAVRSPWQNGICERWGGSLRRELLDHVVPFGEDHLREVLRSYIEYFALPGGAGEPRDDLVEH